MQQLVLIKCSTFKTSSLSNINIKFDKIAQLTDKIALPLPVFIESLNLPCSLWWLGNNNTGGSQLQTGLKGMKYPPTKPLFLFVVYSVI